MLNGSPTRFKTAAFIVVFYHIQVCTVEVVNIPRNHFNNYLHSSSSFCHTNFTLIEPHRQTCRAMTGYMTLHKLHKHTYKGTTRGLKPGDTQFVIYHLRLDLASSSNLLCIDRLSYINNLHRTSVLHKLL